MRVCFGRFTPYLNWAIATSFVLFQFFMQAVAGIMARQWRMEFDLSSFQVGNLSAAFFYTYVLLQMPVGFIYDRFEAKWVLGSAALLLSGACFMLADAQCYIDALIARILMGAGSAFGFVGMLYLTADHFKGKQFVLMVGLAESSAMFGVAFSEVLMSWVVHHFGWRATMGLASLTSLFVSLLVFTLIGERHKGKKKHNTPPVWQTILCLIKQPTILIFGFYGFAMMSVVNVFGSLWGIPFLRDQYAGMHLTVAASLVSMVFIGVGLGCPSLSWLCGKVKNPKSIMVGAIFLTVIFFSIVLYVKNLPFYALYPLLFLTAFFSSAYIQCFDYAKEATPQKMQGVSLALINMMMMLSAPLLQLAIGKSLHKGWHYTQSFTILTVLLTLAGFITLFYKPKPYKKSA